MSERHRRPHGDGSLHRRADGKWVGVLDLGYIDGRRRRKYVYADTEREALAKLRGQRRALERGQDILASVPTLSAWLKEWLTMKEAEGRRALTLRGYRMLARKHIEPALGRIRLDRLKPSDVRHLLETKTAAGLSPATVRHIHGLIRNALADAERHELIARNVAKAVRPPSIRRHEQRFLTIEEAKRLVDVVKGDRLEALWICGLDPRAASGRAARPALGRHRRRGRDRPRPLGAAAGERRAPARPAQDRAVGPDDPGARHDPGRAPAPPRRPGTRGRPARYRLAGDRSRLRVHDGHHAGTP